MSRLSLLAVLLIARAAVATELGDLAAALAPGEWVEVRTLGFDTALLGDVGGHHLLQYTDEAHWDPAEGCILFIGQGHSSNWDGDPTTGSRLLRYDEWSNSWTELPRIPSGDIGHAYDHSAMDPVAGSFVHRAFGGDVLYRYGVSAGSWSTLADIPSSIFGSMQCCGGLEYFAELDSLVLVDGDWGVATYGMTSQQWTRIADTNVDENAGLRDLPMGSYHNITEYNPVHGVMLFGGGNGSSDLYVLDDGGAIRTQAPAPVGVGITQTIVTVDPNSGDYLVVHDSGFYEYDVVNDTWGTLDDPPFFTDNRDGRVVGTVATPVSTHGVVAFLTWNWDDSKVRIYRHSPGSGEPLPPRDGGTTPDGGAADGVGGDRSVVADGAPSGGDDVATPPGARGSLSAGCACGGTAGVWFGVVLALVSCRRAPGRGAGRP